MRAQPVDLATRNPESSQSLQYSLIIFCRDIAIPAGEGLVKEEVVVM